MASEAATTSSQIDVQGSFTAAPPSPRTRGGPREDEGPTSTGTIAGQPKPTRDPAKRKQQNRNACANPPSRPALPSAKPLSHTDYERPSRSQRAHRDRQKKLIHDLWAEVHALRAQNKQLLDLKLESRELRLANGRLRREVEAMERIWIEAAVREGGGGVV